jgi:nickel/cobalt exporter
MDAQALTLITTAASLGVLHTLIGPDHYIPFVAMGQARSWSLMKTVWITLICGMGHVLSSVVIGTIGIAVGSAVGDIEWLEASRGDIAKWMLIAFGLVYMVWGLRAAGKRRVHAHEHSHGDKATPWVLFLVFVFGPCEVLIPLLMYPAAAANTSLCLAVALVFSLCTVATMLVSVVALRYGLSLLPGRIQNGLHRYSHALAGGSIFTCGLLIHIGL